MITEFSPIVTKVCSTVTKFIQSSDPCGVSRPQSHTVRRSNHIMSHKDRPQKSAMPSSLATIEREPSQCVARHFILTITRHHSRCQPDTARQNNTIAWPDDLCQVARSKSPLEQTLTRCLIHASDFRKFSFNFMRSWNSLQYFHASWNRDHACVKSNTMRRTMWSDHMHRSWNRRSMPFTAMLCIFAYNISCRGYMHTIAYMYTM